MCSASAISPKAGRTAVRIEPPCAVADGARWFVVEEAAEQATNLLMSGETNILAPCRYEVDFVPLDGYEKPSRRPVTLEYGRTDEIAVYYTNRALGCLQVNVQPPDALSAGATWKFEHEPASLWRTNATAPCVFPPDGPLFVVFKPVLDWQEPAKVPITLMVGASTSLIVKYTVHRPSLWLTNLWLTSNLWSNLSLTLEGATGTPFILEWSPAVGISSTGPLAWSEYTNVILTNRMQGVPLPPCDSNSRWFIRAKWLP